eukprot:14212717-Alexandrium_andersonii.AAC.1
MIRDAGLWVVPEGVQDTRPPKDSKGNKPVSPGVDLSPPTPTSHPGLHKFAHTAIGIASQDSVLGPYT